MEHGDEEAEEHAVEQVHHRADGGVLAVAVVAGHARFRLLEALVQRVDAVELDVGFLHNPLHVRGRGLLFVLVDVADQRLDEHPFGVGREVAERVLLFVGFRLGAELPDVVLLDEQRAAVDLVAQLLPERIGGQVAILCDGRAVKQFLLPFVQDGGGRIGVGVQLGGRQRVLGQVLPVLL